MIQKKKVLLVGDIGTGQDGYFHVGDEAMWLQNCEDYLSRGWNVYATSRNESDVYKNVIFTKDIVIPTAQAFQEIINNKKGAAYEKFDHLISQVDIVHISGGGNLNNLWPGHFYFRFFIIHIAQERRKSVIVTSQTVGPLDDMQKEIVKTYARAFDLFETRDEHSSPELLISCGLSGDDVQVGPDDALRGFEILGHNSAIKDIGVSLHADILPKLLLSDIYDYDLCAIPHVFLNLSHEMSSLGIPLHESVAYIVNDPRKTIAQVREITSKMCLNITSRYHAAVFSLMNSVPVICISQNEYYRIKFVGLFDYFGVPHEKYIIDLTQYEKLGRAVDEILSDPLQLNIDLLNEKINKATKRIHDITEH